MRDFQNIEKIEAYLSGLLDEAAKKNFEVELQANEPLRKEYQALLAAKEALDLMAFKEIMSRINEQETQGNIRPLKKSRWKQMIVVAASLLALAIATSLIYANFFFSDKALAKKFLENAEPNFSLSKSGSATFSQLDKAKLAFQNKEFDTAANLAESVEDYSSEFPEAQLLAGYALLKTSRGREALPFFQKLIVKEASLKEEGEFFQAVAFLMINEETAARQILLKLAEQDHHAYQEVAKALLAKLSSNWRKFIL